MSAGAPAQVFVALDRGDPAEDRALARKLTGAIEAPGYGFKVNLDAACRVAPESPSLYDQLAKLAELGRPLFLDLKMWNGGRTMAAIAESVAAHPELGVAMINCYPHAGEAFVRRVAETLGEGPTRLYGLTVLTHYGDADTQELYRRDLGEAVAWLARKGVDAGCHGVILPATQLERVADLEVPKLCPGIRPEWFKDPGANAQVQTATPTQALRGGARELVIGTPVTQAEDPVHALRRVLWEVAGAGDAAA